MRVGSGQRHPSASPAADALLYGASAAFAAGLSTLSPLARNRSWAELATPAYAAGAVGALALAAVASRVGPKRLVKTRLLLALCVLVGALAIPLAEQVRWRAESREPAAASLHPYAASEVVVTEGAAAELIRGRDPYAARFASPELAGRSPSIPEHFPYLPGMALFGLPHALVPGGPWTDARVFFAVATAAAAAFALRRWRAPAERRLRALQLLLVLPTGATALVAGGDDMPVLALSLLALVLFERGRHASSAAAIAAASLLKLTAWPLLVALALSGRGARRLGLASPPMLAVGVVVVGVLAAAAASPGAFAKDVLLFPAGLTSLPSPAASTTLGSLVVGAAGTEPLGAARIATTCALLCVACLVAAAVLVGLARSPAGAAGAAAAAGAVLLTLVLLAPVARAGYLVYPLDLFVWAALLRRPVQPARARALTARPVESLAT